MTEFDAVGFGALNIDRLFNVNEIAKEDEESRIHNLKTYCGGSAANTIIGLARLRLQTGFIGKVGSDEEGKLLLNDFKREKVDTKEVAIAKDGRSGSVIGFVDGQGRRALYVDPGVNDSITLQRTTVEYCENTRLLHLSSFVGDQSFESQKKLIKKIPKHVKVSFDPGMLYARRGLLALRPFIRRSFAMLPNEVELKLLTGEEYEIGADKLISEGVKVVGVKMGKRGCYVINGKIKHKVAPFKVKVIDTTGAGDAWNAGFIYGLLTNRTLINCGRLGNLIASRCISKRGARTGLPQISDLQQQGELLE